ncbi:hypothetical protein ACTI_69610 [Actinoplanes sp. OR16]|nr:hypothetical protein ACTI_69610 [Actinoplanes sp. OR16]
MLVFAYRWFFRPAVQGIAVAVTRVLVPLLRIYCRWFLVPMLWLIRWGLRVLGWLWRAYHLLLIRPCQVVWRNTVTPVRRFLRQF